MNSEYQLRPCYRGKINFQIQVSHYHLTLLNCVFGSSFELSKGKKIDNVSSFCRENAICTLTILDTYTSFFLIVICYSYLPIKSIIKLKTNGKENYFKFVHFSSICSVIERYSSAYFLLLHHTLSLYSINQRHERCTVVIIDVVPVQAIRHQGISFFFLQTSISLTLR